ncbi:MAG: glycosyltransferase, partial [Planctomycetes bacterium]|nr:glycosyltransferase [Planctomycetota bacterium]
MRLLFVAHDFPPDRVGGVEVFLRGVAREFVRRGHDVTILCGREGPVRGPSRAEDQSHALPGARVVRLYRGRADAGLAGRWPLLRTFRHAGVARLFRRVVASLKPDVIHLHHTLHLAAAVADVALSAAPTLLTVHDHWFFCQRLTLTHADGRACDGPGDGSRCSPCLAAGPSGPLGRLPPMAARLLLRLARPPALTRMRTAEHRALLRRFPVVTHPAHFQRAMLLAAGVPARRLRLVPYGVDLGAEVGGRG